MNNDDMNAQEPRQKLGEILLAGQKLSRNDLERALEAILPEPAPRAPE